MYQRSTHTHSQLWQVWCILEISVHNSNTFNKSWPWSCCDKEILRRIHDNIKRVASSKLSGTKKMKYITFKNVSIRHQIAVTSRVSGSNELGQCVTCRSLFTPHTENLWTTGISAQMITSCFMDVFQRFSTALVCVPYNRRKKILNLKPPTKKHLFPFYLEKKGSRRQMPRNRKN